MLFKKSLLAVVLGIVAAGSSPLAEATPVPTADNYPVRPLTLIVPYPPGGPNDTIARTVAPELAAALGVSVVIENKPGAAGNIGASRSEERRVGKEGRGLGRES